MLLLATGSEVHPALAAQRLLADGGVPSRVVSLPCLEWFAAQPRAYREEVLPPGLTARVGVGAGVALGWRELVGPRGRIVSLDRFGASADYQRSTPSSASPPRRWPTPHGRASPRPGEAPSVGRRTGLAR
ncbi:transketolase-like TK C-terminal-containing protein [Kitasatospora paranensis]|uniref:Transketolase C-terminal domain-containing protein n=1 Tax=Kitasatospora paranensis TaxID=258053 RepID=A0ABW2G6N2_9ACTN